MNSFYIREEGGERGGKEREGHITISKFFFFLGIFQVQVTRALLRQQLGSSTARQLDSPTARDLDSPTTTRCSRMPIKESTEDGVPSTWVPPTLYDFRSMPDGPRGYKVGITKKGHLGSKRKLEAYAEQVRVFCACACPLCPL
jgi:hypothetical protein